MYTPIKKNQHRVHRHKCIYQFMSKNYSLRKIPRSRIATFDVFAMGMKKNHVAALLEFDVTKSRQKLKSLRRDGANLSFNAFILKCIANTLQQHPEAAAFLYNKRNLIEFNQINISFLIEKGSGSSRVPLPLVITDAGSKSIADITGEINRAVKQQSGEADIVLNQKTSKGTKLYYHLPAFLRRLVWQFMLKRPRLAFAKMGNVAVTSVGMMGKINGWFIHRSVHPLSFGIGSVIKKPVVINDSVEIREILNMTILVDHNVIDGAPMVRFLNKLTQNIENYTFQE